MKIVLLLLLTIPLALAQTKPKSTTALTAKEQAEIQAIARDKVKNLIDLLNTLTFEDISAFEQDEVIKNSFLPNANQIFLNDGVIIEDDIDPNHSSSAAVVDTPVETYLRNLALFYTKTASPSIRYSNVRVLPVLGTATPYVKVFFTTTFTSKHTKIDKPYVPTNRVAEFKVERAGKQWLVLITRLAFENPGEGMTLRTKPVVKVVAPAPVPETIKKSLTTEQQKQKTHYRTQGWLLVLGGVVGLATSYYTYSKLQADYKTYTAKVEVLNAEYDQWRELSAQPTGNRMTPVSFSTYANPGSYVAYGTGAAGLGLSLTGISRLLKSGRVDNPKR